ncbi:MAG TPA: hypothetical protein V6C97_29680 [Oculatellaceae cyanobacterium]
MTAFFRSPVVRFGPTALPLLAFAVASSWLGCATSCLAEDGYGRADAVAQWQMQRAHDRQQDRMKELMDKEDDLKRDIYGLDTAISECVKKEKYCQQELRQVQQEILSLKMQQL